MPGSALCLLTLHDWMPPQRSCLFLVGEVSPLIVMKAGPCKLASFFCLSLKEGACTGVGSAELDVRPELCYGETKHGQTVSLCHKPQTLNTQRSWRRLANTRCLSFPFSSHSPTPPPPKNAGIPTLSLGKT